MARKTGTHLGTGREEVVAHPNPGIAHQTGQRALPKEGSLEAMVRKWGT